VKDRSHRGYGISQNPTRKAPDVWGTRRDSHFSPWRVRESQFVTGMCRPYGAQNSCCYTVPQPLPAAPPALRWVSLCDVKWLDLLPNLFISQLRARTTCVSDSPSKTGLPMLKLPDNT
jgi:hypothetical protein